MNKIRIHSKAYLYTIVAALVIGAALITAEGAGATFRPTLAQLARIKDALSPGVARFSGPSRLEQLAALKDGTLPDASGVTGPSASRLEILAALKDSGAPEMSSVNGTSASRLEQLAALKEDAWPAASGVVGPSASRLEILAALKEGRDSATSGASLALVPGRVDLSLPARPQLLGVAQINAQLRSHPYEFVPPAR